MRVANAKDRDDCKYRKAEISWVGSLLKGLETHHVLAGVGKHRASSYNTHVYLMNFMICSLCFFTTASRRHLLFLGD